jgi:hypothetical protein
MPRADALPQPLDHSGPFAARFSALLLRSVAAWAVPDIECRHEIGFFLLNPLNASAGGFRRWCGRIVIDIGVGLCEKRFMNLKN